MSGSALTIEGNCADQFAEVARQFRANFEADGEVGAAIALYVAGELQIDLWGGLADPATNRVWNHNTLVNVWSTTKGVTAACFALAVERGLCSYEDRVAAHWPEFGVQGKDAITIAELLSHQGGLSAFAEPTSLAEFADAEVMADRLARQDPLWEPGTQSGYHAITVGFLATALFRRIEGRSIARFIAEEMTSLDLHVGLGPDDSERVALIMPAPNMISEVAVPKLDSLQAATLGNPALDPGAANTLAWRKAEIPSANGFANARGLAGLYSSLIGLGPERHLTLSSDVLKQATKIRYSGEDAVLKIETNWAAGFLRNSMSIYGPEPRAFGHSGWGGSFAFADPTRNLAFAYVMNAMRPELVGDPRGLALLSAVYKSL